MSERRNAAVQTADLSSSRPKRRLVVETKPVLQKTNTDVLVALGGLKVTSQMLKKATPYFFIGPAVLILCFTLIYPVFYGLRLSFYDWSLRDMASAEAPKLTSDTFELLQQEGLPDDVLEKLGSLKNRRFRTQEDFFSKVERAIGAEDTTKYKSVLLNSSLKKPEFIGLGNYRELAKSEFFWTSVKVTLKFSLSVVIFEILLGLFLALLLEGQMKGLRLFRTIFILPIMIAPVVVGLTWRFLYDPSFGMVNYFLGFLGIEPQTWLSDPALALPAVILADIWQWTPFVFLLLLAGLQGIPQSFLEAAEVDGATYLQNLFYIKLPQIKAIIGITAVLRLIDSFRSLVVLFVMTEGGPGMSTEILSLHLYKTAFTSQRLGLASAIAVVLIAIILSLATVLLWTMRSAEEAH
jgi:multiple sugar transport system permease protein